MKAKNWEVYSYGGYFKGENIYTGADAEPAETRNIIQANQWRTEYALFAYSSTTEHRIGIEHARIAFSP